MRIELNAGGLSGSSTIYDFTDDFSSLISKSKSMISVFQLVKSSTYNVNGGVGTLETAVSNVESRLADEEEKETVLEAVKDKYDEFVENTHKTDKRVASLVEKHTEEFYNVNPWSRPEPGLDFWGSIGEWVNHVIEWINGRQGGDAPTLPGTGDDPSTTHKGSSGTVHSGAGRRFDDSDIDWFDLDADEGASAGVDIDGDGELDITLKSDWFSDWFDKDVIGTGGFLGLLGGSVGGCALGTLGFISGGSDGQSTLSGGTNTSDEESFSAYSEGYSGDINIAGVDGTVTREKSVMNASVSSSSSSSWDFANHDVGITADGSVDFSAYEESVSYTNEYGNADAEISVGNVYAEGTFDTGLFDEEGNLDPHFNLNGEAGVSVVDINAEGVLGDENNNLHGSVDLSALEASAYGKVNIDSDNVEVKVGAEAYLVKGTVKSGFTFFGIDTDIEVSGGIGAEGSAGFSFTDTGFEIDLGAAVGVGGEVKLSVDWEDLNLDSVVDTYESISNTVEEVYDGVTGFVEDTVEGVGDWFDGWKWW